MYKAANKSALWYGTKDNRLQPNLGVDQTEWTYLATGATGVLYQKNFISLSLAIIFVKWRDSIAALIQRLGVCIL